MANHEHPCPYCHEDMRLMSDMFHEEKCAKQVKEGLSPSQSNTPKPLILSPLRSLLKNKMGGQIVCSSTDTDSTSTLRLKLQARNLENSNSIELTLYEDGTYQLSGLTTSRR